MTTTYLVMDTETGGTGQEVSLLTAYFGLYDSEFNFLSDLSLSVKPDNGIYMVTGEALGINKINLVEHEKTSVTYKEAGTSLYEYLDAATVGGKYKPLPLGHNVKFDVDGIKRALMSNNTWNKFVSYRVLDTGTIGQFLKLKGKIPDTISGSLSSYCKHFNIDSSKAHTAQGDCEMTVEVFKEMMKL